MERVVCMRWLKCFFLGGGGASSWEAEEGAVTGSGERKPSGGRHSTPSRAHNSQNGRAGLGLSNDTSHVAVRAQGEAVEGKQDQKSRRGKSRSPVAFVPVFLQFYGEPERKIQRDTHGKNQLKATSKMCMSTCESVHVNIGPLFPDECFLPSY